MMVGGVSGAWWSHQDGLGARGPGLSCGMGDLVP